MTEWRPQDQQLLSSGSAWCDIQHKLASVDANIPADNSGRTWQNRHEQVYQCVYMQTCILVWNLILFFDYIQDTITCRTKSMFTHFSHHVLYQSRIHRNLDKVFTWHSNLHSIYQKCLLLLLHCLKVNVHGHNNISTSTGLKWQVCCVFTYCHSKS